MRLLALDTSTEYLSLALYLDGEIICRETHAGIRHSELILPMLEVLLVEAGVSLTSLDGIAFGQGPGTFTGIRIGCGVAQGLAFGADLPVVGIATLLALAESVEQDCVIACLDARMGEVYHAAYRREAPTEGGWREIHAPGLYAPQATPVVEGDDWVGVGSGFRVGEGALRQHYAGQVKQVFDDRFPHAREIARLASRQLSLGRGVPAWETAPLYIRDKVALKTSER
ncbi:MAG: tRNA (adenosine(37)-N6)-threonylcarbamoyltransferase complex dimerization subunit type 1 TsaB [Burkholderiales bacterium]|nr:tRNA (adenosine(37)-N6)-threonylcarbamoyltransferase complex dimerization subunit type 1 TsaB [Burkholderiales bacterium]